MMPIAVRIQIVSWEELCAAFDSLHNANQHLRTHAPNEDDFLARALLQMAMLSVLYEMENFVNRTGGDQSCQLP